MRIAVAGCGAMGSLIGGLLAKDNVDVTFVDPWKAHVDAINTKGLFMEPLGKEGEYVKVKATTDPNSVGVVDVVIFLVKGTKTVEAIKKSLSMINDNTIVMTLQNGVGNTDKIAEYVKKENVAFGVIDFSSTLVGPGHISFQLAEGKIACNTNNGENNPRFNDLIEIMNKSGLHAYVSEVANYRVWKKLVINANFNVLCGILGIKMGELMDEESGWVLMRGITKELVEVANKKGINLKYNDSIEHLRNLGEEVRDHYPSLAQDVARKVPTEIDYINGAVVREGKKLGITTPYNETVYHLMKIIENTYDVGKEFTIEK